MRPEMYSGMEVLTQDPEMIANVPENDSQDKVTLGPTTQQELLHGISVQMVQSKHGSIS
jgi:hypothetical protein